MKRLMLFVAVCVACEPALPAEEVGLNERPRNSTCLAFARPSEASISVALEPAFSALLTSAPIQLLQIPGMDSRFYVVERGGRVLSFTSADGSNAETFIDLRANVSTEGEGGLLAIAFHPAFASNRRFFASYTTRKNGVFTSRISEFTANSESSALGVSERIVLEVEQPYTNHNGGWIGFPPTGEPHLFVALGDGGSGGDPHGHGQNTQTLLGSILRLDVDAEAPYAIPSGNPFADDSPRAGQGRAEIFAWGLRNPWRASFDRETAALWVGDVGQDRFEEIDLIEAGGNYGWKVREGNDCYAADSCENRFVDPIFVYGRDEGRSITGGFVYRGRAIPELVGRYIFADFSSGSLFALSQSSETARAERLLTTGLNPAGFGAANDGELFVLDLAAGIHRLVRRQSESGGIRAPALLSGTGCVEQSDPTKIVGGLIPYEPVAALWSDGAEKSRWLAIPDGTTISIAEDGDFEFPVGSVLMKEFRREGRRLETRLYMRHADGEWGGYTYVWNDAQSDANLVSSGTRLSTPSGVWDVPSQAECQQCHSRAAGRTLGLEVGQLDIPTTYIEGGVVRRANQLETLTRIGVVQTSVDPTLPRFASYADPLSSTAAKARSYLHSNCSHCHRPNGPARGELDLRFTASNADIGCNREPLIDSLGLATPLIVAPGNPEQSILSLRMRSLDVHRMPQIGSRRVDNAGVALVESYIREANCRE